jgi:flagellar hook-length control protein FliK
LLTANLTADPQAGGSTTQTHSDTSTAASPFSTAIATPAALAAAQLIAASHVGSAQARTDASTTALSSPVGTSAWTDELGAKVTWMAHQGIESASLQLSPEHLGPVQVSISVHEGQASVWFGAAQPDTRTALQQSLPQLRQLFASQGLSLTDAGVSREPPRGQSRPQSTRTATPVGGIAAVNVDGSAGRASVAGLGLVDTYA